MALFRKKLPADEYAYLIAGLFQQRFSLLCTQIVKEINERSGGLTKACFLDNAKSTKGAQLWIFAAAHLSQMRQTGEAKDVSRSVLEHFLASPDSTDVDPDTVNTTMALTHFFQYKAREIVYAFHNDNFLFHNVSCAIIKYIYPETSDFVSSYGNEIPGTVIISGMELASCLRGIDFYLREYKLR